MRTRTFVDDGVDDVDLDHEVVAEEDEADDGEEVDENDGEERGEQDAATVLRHRPDHVEQRLLAVHHVQQLRDTHKIYMYMYNWINSSTVIRTD